MTTVFSYEDLRMQVESTAESHVAYLREFLRPQFEVGTDGAHDCGIALIEDDPLYEASQALGARDGGERRDAFALDGSVIRLPLWNARAGTTALFDEQFRVFYAVGARGRGISILTRSGNLLARTALMRVVRELAMNHSQQKGGLLLHAAAFAVGGKGVLLAGPKSAGKTTLLIHALRAGAAQYVSNDRVLVSPGSVEARLRGMPTIVTLRPQTLDLFPWLAPRMAARPYNHRLSLREVAEGLAPTSRSPDGRIGLSPAQFCELVGASPLAHCEVAAVVFPQVTDEPGTLSLREVGSREGGKRLEQALFGRRTGKRTSDLFCLPGDPPPPGEAALAALCRRLASTIPCFECRLGRGAYEDSATALIELAS